MPGCRAAVPASPGRCTPRTARPKPAGAQAAPAGIRSPDLTTLPERDRAVIELVDLAGLTLKEAATLGPSPGAVRMRLMRTRAQLRKHATTPNQIRSDTHD